MAHRIKKYFELIDLVLRHGRWLHSGENFIERRRESLLELQDFIPENTYSKSSMTTFPLRGNSLMRNIVVQLSFVKNSFQSRGGHLLANTLAYIRIPKSASTSLSKEMLEKIYPALKQKSIDEKQINYLMDVNIITHVTESNSHSYFTMVRNPLSRLVSVYRGYFENDSPDYIYQDYLFGILPQRLSFADFVNRIACIPDRLKDQHLKPQHCFLEYYEQKKIQVRVFKLEEPEKINSFLEQHELHLPHLNKSVEPYDYRSYFTTSTLRVACEIYRKDIERFGYEKETQALKEDLKTVHL